MSEDGEKENRPDAEVVPLHPGKEEYEKLVKELGETLDIEAALKDALGTAKEDQIKATKDKSTTRPKLHIVREENTDDVPPQKDK